MRTHLPSPPRLLEQPAPPLCTYMRIYGARSAKHDVAIFHLSRRWCVDMKGTLREGSRHIEDTQVWSRSLSETQVICKQSFVKRERSHKVPFFLSVAVRMTNSLWSSSCP